MGIRSVRYRCLTSERVFALTGGGAVSDSRETAAVVALLRYGDRPWPHYAEQIEHVGSALAVLHGDIGDDTPADGPTLFPSERAAIADADLDLILEEIRGWERERMQVLTVLDDAYPANLRRVHDRPPILFVHGELAAEDARSVAVVGTRQASLEGAETARRIARELVGGGYTVVSGLAEGIDTASHLAALEAGGRTVAVIGTGLRRFYPGKNAALQRRLAAETAVISQFWPDQPPTRRTFPMRNVVMSGFSLATVVVEASETSGAMMQARFALGHNRPVFLLRALLRHNWAREYAALPGATVIDSGAEVLGPLERLTTLDPLALA
jgi:DNA processing protein